MGIPIHMLFLLLVEKASSLCKKIEIFVPGCLEFCGTFRKVVYKKCLVFQCMSKVEKNKALAFTSYCGSGRPRRNTFFFTFRKPSTKSLKTLKKLAVSQTQSANQKVEKVVLRAVLYIFIIYHNKTNV